MVAPGGGAVHGMKTTDGQMRPLGKFFLPFWGVRWEDGRKTVWFSGEKPGETGRNNGESQGRRGGCMGTSARGIVQKNKRPPAMA